MGALQAPPSAASGPADGAPEAPEAPQAWYCGCCGLVRPARGGPDDATAR